MYFDKFKRWLEIAGAKKESSKNKISQVRKRDGSIVPFDREKVVEAIFHAAQSIGGRDRSLAAELADEVIDKVNSSMHYKSIPSVEQISDMVEKVLIEKNHVKTAKAFIIYRQKHKEMRDRKSAILGKFVDTDLTENALRVLKERYLLKDKTGKLIETPEELFRRVSENIALADAFYGKKNKEVQETADEFYGVVSKLEFLPNSPTLMNAGTAIQQLSACFVLPVGDSMEEIFDAIKNTALIHKSGGGTGFSFSRLRPKNDLVMSTKGVASGPLSFMKVFDAATNVVKQGGKRRGANMGVLRVDHPDILDFIGCKENNDELNNFNISVGLTEKFMKAVINDKEYELVSPKTKKVARKLEARQVFDLIIAMAWNNGEPGILFLDRINKDNPTPRVGEIESTNPCVVGDTLVSTEKGLMTIKSMADNYSDGGISIATDNRVPIEVMNSNGTVSVLEMKEKGISQRQISCAFKTGVKDTYKLLTKSGCELIATSDHKVMTTDGWLPIHELDIRKHEVLVQHGEGQFNTDSNLPFDVNNNLTGKNGRKYNLNLPDKWSKELGQTLGWLIGDGWLRDEGKDCRVGFTFGRDDIKAMSYLKRIINNYYDADIKEIKRKNNVYHLSYHSKYFVDFFKKLGVTSQKAGKKRVPQSLFTAPKDAVIGFMQGLFSADGSVRNNPKAASQWVVLTSKSKELLEDTQKLLFNLGIKSRIFDRSRKPRSSLFKHTTKNGELKEYGSDGILYELGIFSESLLKFRDEINFMLNHKSEKLSRISIKKPRQKFFDKIREISYAGKREVYDLTEPVTHSMICNSIVVHQCGEQPLLPNEACNLGSINLGKFVIDGKIDWDHLREVTRTAVHFLDNVIDMNKYPLPQIDEMAKANRKIGLGIMGWADMLVQLGIPYNSDKGVKLGEKVMKFIDDEAKKMSQDLAKQRGPFPNFRKSIFYDKKEPKLRNATRTTIAPTGTLSMIGDASGGIEPNFSICYMKRVMDGQELLYVNKFFERCAKEKGFFTEDLMRRIANKDSIQNVKDIPEDVREYFVVAHDVSPEWHLRMQGAFQRHCNNAVSKTVNFPNTATIKDVEDVYMLAYKLGCKGVTIYRDGSRDLQVLNIEHVKKEDKAKKKDKDKKEKAKKKSSSKEKSKASDKSAKIKIRDDKSVCPECGGKMNLSEGCASCPSCGYSYCS